MKDLISTLFKKTNIKIADKQAEKFVQFLHLFIDWNNKINLTAIKEPEDIIIKHFIDSLLIMKTLDLNQYKSLIDIGSGGGFPGIPLAIMFPHLQITVCDSVGKKMKAVDDMIQSLNLNNIKTIIGRAEEFGRERGFRESFDIATGRAVASLPVLLEYLSPFVKKGGSVVAYKSKEYEEELELSQNAINLLSLKLEKIYKDELPDQKGERVMLIFDKIEKIDTKYPRDVGIPKKTPLI